MDNLQDPQKKLLASQMRLTLEVLNEQIKRATALGLSIAIATGQAHVDARQLNLTGESYLMIFDITEY